MRSALTSVRSVAAWACGLVVCSPGVALACPVCFGQSDAPMAAATNMGIWVMLGVVVAVLASFASFFVYLIRRANRLAEQGPVQTSDLSVRASSPREGIA